MGWKYVLFFIFTLSLSLYQISWLTEKDVITINHKEMTITKRFLWNLSVERFDVSKITDVTVLYDIPAWDQPYHTLSISEGHKILWVRDPVRIYFTYDGNTECIGKHLNQFHAEYIVNAITKAQQ